MYFHKKRGQALIEFVGVLVFFLAFVVLFLDLGRVILSMQSMYNAAYEGVRKASLTRLSLDPLSVAKTTAENELQNSMPYYKTGKTTCDINSTAPQGSLEAGYPIKVVVSCSLQPMFADSVFPNVIRHYLNFKLSRSYTSRMEDP